MFAVGRVLGVALAKDEAGNRLREIHRNVYELASALDRGVFRETHPDYLCQISKRNCPPLS